MCGIAGLYDVSASTHPDELLAIVDRMSSRLAHRGPDHAGRWVDAALGAALGQERLAVRDLSPSGDQPMTSSCGRYVMVYNGEVYSQQEIARDLGPRARTLRGHSDTEVILEACAEWGVERAIDKMIGMFAFALLDKQSRTLTLVRDRLGIKPLYWSQSGSTTVFGSELKAIVASDRIPLTLDRDALSGYMKYNYIASPDTIYEGVHQVRPGSMITVNASGDISQVQYWDIADYAAVSRVETDLDTSLDALDALLADSVSRRLVSDVPIGALLSGGIDSSLVTALMVEASDSRVQTFTIGFEDSRYDEAPHARAIAEHLGTDHHELTARPEHAMSLITDIPRYYDEPFADSSQIPTMLVAELTRREVTVALTGDGGDELFGGYSRYAVTETTRDRLGGLPRPIQVCVGGAVGLVPAAVLDRASHLLPRGLRKPDFGRKAHRVADGLKVQDLGTLYRDLLSHWPKTAVIGGRLPVRPEIPIPIGGSRRQTSDAMRLEDMRYYLPDDILTKVDRATMRVSLEARVPLLDHRVVELAWTLPSETFHQDGRPKWPLRRALYRRVPSTLVDRPKSGFGVPISAWLRGPLRNWADGLLDPTLLASQGVLDPLLVRSVWADHLRGVDNGYRLWDILVLQMWLGANPRVL